MMAEANAYRERVVENSKGEAERFTKLYDEYRKAPEVTRERLYLQSIQSVLSRSNKVMINVDEGNNVFYLPLDRMMQDATKRDSRSQSSASQSAGSGNDNTRNMSDRIRSGAERLRGSNR